MAPASDGGARVQRAVSSGLFVLGALGAAVGRPALSSAALAAGLAVLAVPRVTSRWPVLIPALGLLGMVDMWLNFPGSLLGAGAGFAYAVFWPLLGWVWLLWAARVLRRTRLLSRGGALLLAVGSLAGPWLCGSLLPAWREAAELTGAERSGVAAGAVAMVLSLWAGRRRASGDVPVARPQETPLRA